MTVSRVRLPGGDLELSRIVAGCWRLLDWNASRAELDRWIRGSLDLGITTFDHADIYGGHGCEAAFGAAIDPGLRDRIEIVTKCGIAMRCEARPQYRVNHYDTSAAHVVDSVESSLRALRTDRIDVLLIHRPDPLLDADEVARAFGELRRAGKVRTFGVSNFLPWQLDLLQARLDAPLVTNQIELHVGRLEPLHDGTLDQCQRLRVPPMAWSPLAGGALVTSSEDRWQRIRAVLGRIAAARGASPEQVAIAWILRHPARVIPVLGTGQLARLRDLAEAEQIDLDRQEWFEIWEASAGQEVP